MTNSIVKVHLHTQPAIPIDSERKLRIHNPPNASPKDCGLDAARGEKTYNRDSFLLRRESSGIFSNPHILSSLPPQALTKYAQCPAP